MAMQEPLMRKLQLVRLQTLKSFNP